MFGYTFFGTKDPRLGGQAGGPAYLRWSPIVLAYSPPLCPDAVPLNGSGLCPSSRGPWAVPPPTDLMGDGGAVLPLGRAGKRGSAGTRVLDLLDEVKISSQNGTRPLNSTGLFPAADRPPPHRPPTILPRPTHYQHDTRTARTPRRAQARTPETRAPHEHYAHTRTTVGGSIEGP